MIEVSDNLTNWRYNDDGFFEDATAELSRIDNGDGVRAGGLNDFVVPDVVELGYDIKFGFLGACRGES